jgi:crossover junction endodeoxyribonuclease RuvC
MRCLGLDLGTIATGIAVIEGQDFQDLKLTQEITLKSPKLSLPARLSWQAHEIQKVLLESQPDVVALETTFYGKDVRSLKALSQIRGAVLVVIQNTGIPTVDCAPQAVKKAVTGQGNASKDQVARMMMHLLNRASFSSQDASDAAAVAYTGILKYLHQKRLEEMT